MTREQQKKVMEGAPTRQKAYVEKLLSVPIIRAAVRAPVADKPGRGKKAKTFSQSKLKVAACG